MTRKFIIAAALLLALSARAADAPAGAAAAEPPASAAEVKGLAEEVRRLKLELGLRDVEPQSWGGLGPAASKVYFAPKGLSLGGYGEAAFTGVAGRGSSTDLLRLVLYAGWRFSDRIVFNSEIEFEHAGKEVHVEFAYLDLLLSEAVRLRVGNVLLPVGLVNELHEPPFFNGVLRPEVETLLIPSTWNENGLLLHGEAAGVRWHAGLVTGLDLFAASDEEPISAGEWLRRARSGAGESRADTWAGVAALHVPVGPAALGGSVYRGRADQRSLLDAAGRRVAADVTLAEVHATAAWRGLSGKALAAAGALSHAGEASAALGLTTPLGSRVRGGSLEVAFDVLSLGAPGGEASLAPFARLEAYDLHAGVPAGFARDASLDRRLLTLGATWKPLPTVAFKADWQRRTSRAGGEAEAALHLGAGFEF